MGDYRHFTVLVAGDNHSDMIRKYDKNLKVDRHKVYSFSDAEKLRWKKISILENALKAIGEEKSDFLKEEIDYLKSIDSTDFYIELTEGLDIDEESGDAYSDMNPDGNYDTANIGGVFALPLITKDGKETYSTIKGQVDWSKIHHSNTKAYEVAWDTVMEGKKPETDDERKIFENMKNRRAYFEYYGNRDTYIMSSTAFWAYAFVSEETGWVELEPTVSQLDWVINFYDRFVKNLDDNTLLTIYECTRIQ